jgi:23S rRNA (pseudouridine1915-N3)-methyltransferase
MRDAIREGDFVVALEVGGRAMTTPQLSEWLAARMAGGRDLAFLVGGPDGLDPGLSKRADFRWSLSPLTWPHGLVRVMVAEQLYRAHSLLQGHPYHRA